MVPFAPLLSALAEIPDPRRAQGTRYPLAPLLLFCILAVLAGATSYRGIVTFLAVHRDRLGHVYGVRRRRAPAVTTLRNLFLALDPAALEAAFRRHARHLGEGRPDRQRAVALDGKTLRRSFDRLHDRAAAHVLGAFAADAALILGHHEVPDAPAEVEAVRVLIQELGLTGVVFTVDALHCQKTFARAERTGNALLARVKANQPRLHKAVVALCARRAPVDADLTIDRDRRGRHEQRRVEVFAPTPADLPPGWREYVAAVARIIRRTWLRDAGTGLWRRREEVAYYACQVRLDAPSFGCIVRGHWGIENRAHHVRDRVLREDDSRIRTKPGIFARLRSFALNLLRANGVGNVSEAIYANALSLDRLLALGAG
jgi:predicted transposase YbfD/YdcC